MKYTYLFIFLLYASFVIGQKDAVFPTTERQTIYSQHLGEERSYQVYLPPSYYYSDKGNYPVIYLIDGDYNFYYQTAIIESLATVSEKIPEVIVVGISDRGNAGYRLNCTTPSANNEKGNSPIFRKFIAEELKPAITKQYRVSTYDILIGHSLGGLFATDYLLAEPTAFDNYIAIDPSYWWDDYVIINRADSLLKKRATLGSRFYVSLADTKQMGVRRFVGVLDKYFPLETDWHFKHYKNENHGSVGLVTVRDALLLIFKDYALTREQFYELESAEKITQYYKDLSAKYATAFPIPPNFLGNILHYYLRKEKTTDLATLEKEIKTHFPNSLNEFYVQFANSYLEKDDLDKAANIFQKSIEQDPLAFKAYDGLSKVYLKKNQLDQAKMYSEKAIEIAKKVRVKQWLLNELQSQLLIID